MNVTASTSCGCGVAVADQVGDAAGDDARLAGAGAGEDQQRAVDVQDRFALFGIQGVEEIHIGARVLRLAERDQLSIVGCEPDP